MDYRVLGAVRKFFREEPERPKLMSGLRVWLSVKLDFTTYEVEELIRYLLASGYLHQSTTRFRKDAEGNVFTDALLAFGDSELLQPQH